MVGADDHTYHMGGHKTHKADGAADGHTNTDQYRNGDQNDQLGSPDIHAHVAGVVLAHRKGVQFPCVQHNDAAADQQDHRQDSGIQIAGVLQAAQRPEGNVFDLFACKGDDHIHGAGNKHGVYHTDQDDGVGGQGVIQLIGQSQNNGQRQEGKQNGHEHGACHRQSREGDPKGDGQHGTQRGARGHAQRGAVGQRIFQQALHGGTGQRQRSTGQSHAKHAGQTHRQDDGGGQSLRHDHITAGKQILDGQSDHRDGVLQWNIDAADAHTGAQCRHGDQRKNHIFDCAKMFGFSFHGFPLSSTQRETHCVSLMCFSADFIRRKQSQTSSARRQPDGGQGGTTRCSAGSKSSDSSQR